jgi:S1-C subfamily serine protease
MRLHTKIALVTLLAASGALPAAPPPAERPGWLGLGYTYHLAAEPSRPNWLYVQHLAPDGPAERGGLHTQDVITAIDGKPLRFSNDREVMDFFARFRPRQTISFTVVRPSGTKTVRVVATPMTDEAYALWQQNAAKAKARRG